MRDIPVINRPRRGVYRHSSGFSLIEIMVVLIILLIGILAIVRLFPPGFLSLFKTGEITIGNAVAQQTSDAVAAQNNLQEAIVGINPNTGMPDSTILPDDLNDVATGFVPGLDPWYWSNVSKIRNIIGENFRIPVPTTNTGNGYGAIYPLMFGPVSNAFTATADGILVYGVPLQRTIQSAYPSLANPGGYAALSDESQYAIDYDNLMVAFYPRVIDPSRPVAFRQFTISYDYYTNPSPGVIGIQFQPNLVGTTVVTVPDVPLVNGQLPPPTWQPLFNSPLYASPYTSDPKAMTPPAAMYLGNVTSLPLPQNTTLLYGIRHDSEEVSRKFRLALVGNTVEQGGVPTWSNSDPYEYAWYSAQNPGNTANPGILIFNPSGHNMQQQNAYGTQALQARVDYQIFDNHVLRDDRNVPASAPFTIALSVPGLRLGGDILDNTNPLNTFNNTLLVYNGLYRDAANTTPDIIIYNVNTGVQVGSWTNLNATPGTGVLTVDASDPAPLDSKTSILTLNPNAVAALNLAGASLRIFYRTQGDWAVQVQKAAAHYKETTSPLGVDYFHYYIGDGTTGGPTRIYFAPCDAGKTVVLGQFYANYSNPLINGNLPNRDQTYQIPSDPSQFETVGGFSLPYVDVATPTNSIIGFSASQTGRRVDNVYGSSIKSRVVWRDSQRWRKLDNDTYLTQRPAQ